MFDEVINGSRNTEAMSLNEIECKIRTDNLSPDLQVDLRQLGISREGFVSPAELEMALGCLVNERKGRLAMRRFDGRMKASMDAIDPDNDGYINFKQIEEALALYFSKMQRSKYTTVFWALFATTCIIFLGATFGLVYLVVDLRKDTASVNNQLVSRTTGEPLQTASTEFVIQNGIMAQRPSSAKQNRRDNTLDSSDVKLIPFSAPISAVSSTMSLAQISTLTRLDVSYQPTGGAVSVPIKGFALVPAQGLPSGKYVVFQTAAGQLILNGTNISPAQKQLSVEELFALAFPTAAGGGAPFPCILHCCRDFFPLIYLTIYNVQHLSSCGRERLKNIAIAKALLTHSKLTGPDPLCHRGWSAAVPAARRRLHQRLHQQLLRGSLQHWHPVRLGLRLPYTAGQLLAERMPAIPVRRPPSCWPQYM